MDAEKRRGKILEYLQNVSQPMAGTELARLLGVSRQVIVQDIALLRAVNKNILSTSKGYMLFQPLQQTGYRRVIKVSHNKDQIQDELYTIVDLGGQVEDVIVEHPIYGQINVDLVIRSRADAVAFLRKVRDHATRPLTDLTDGVHFHTITAASKQILDAVETELKEKGYI